MLLQAFNGSFQRILQSVLSIMVIHTNSITDDYDRSANILWMGYRDNRKVTLIVIVTFSNRNQIVGKDFQSAETKTQLIG